MKGSELITLLTNFMDGEAIGETFAYQLLNMGRSNIESSRDWMKLRTFKDDYSFSSSDGYSDLKDLPDGFLKTYGDKPLKLINGSDVTGLREIPMDERDHYKDESDKFYINHRESQLAIMGGLSTSKNGTLYYIKESPEISADIIWFFPTFAHPLLVIEALIVHRGEVDFDEINARMINNGLGTREQMLDSLIQWDARLQVNSLRGKRKGDLFNK